MRVGLLPCCLWRQQRGLLMAATRSGLTDRLAPTPRALLTCGPQPQGAARLRLYLCQPCENFVIEASGDPGSIEPWRVERG